MLRKLPLVALALVALSATASTAVTRWTPPAKPTFYWQLQGTLRTDNLAQVVDADLFDTPTATVKALHAQGKHVVCYLDAGTWENWRSDASKFPTSVRGKSNGWAGERWLDVRKLSVLQPIMKNRLALCRSKGFDGVEPDNIDGYGNSTGFPITAAQQLVYDRWLASTAHSLGLAILQKNDPEQAAALQPSFDGVLTEQCNAYAECGSFASYLRAGKPVLDIEYDPTLYPAFCTADAKLGIVGALYDQALDGSTHKDCP